MLISRVLVLPSQACRAVGAVFGRAQARRIDREDERWARRRRIFLGARRDILSWSREVDGCWRARLSNSETPRTIERTGHDRREAIGRAELAVKRLLIMRKILFDSNSTVADDGKS